MLDFLVVGGGISGLSLSWYLSQLRPDWDFRVVEASAVLGGKILSIREGGFLFEAGPESFINRSPEVLELVEELGLVDELLQADDGARRRFLYADSKLKALPSGPLSLLMSSTLPFGARIRALKEPWVRAQAPDYEETVSQFMERRLGPVVRDLYVDAFVSGIFAGDPGQLSIEASFPRLVQWEREHGSVVRGAMRTMKARRKDARLNRIMPAGTMLSFKDGMGTLPARLGERLGVEKTCTSWPVEKIVKCDSGWEVRGPAGTLRTRRLILTTPASRTATLLEGIDEELAHITRSIPHAGIVVTGLAFQRAQIRHRLNGFGYLCPEVTESSILGCLFSSSIFPGQRAPYDHVLLRVMAGGSRHPERVSLSPEESTHNALDAIRPVLGVQGAPVWSRSWSHNAAIPQYVLGHGQRMDALEARAHGHTPGLWLGGEAYRGHGIIDCIVRASELAQRVVDSV